ncbi:MAG: 4Fe-4S binding protein [Proteobacteria bacterium]|nr:4Fe-4S binding protein [Pseudomonadota bacterium]
MAYRITDDCTSCGSCADECPVDCIEEGDDIYVINQDECTECGTCVETCPVDAIIEE